MCDTEQTDRTRPAHPLIVDCSTHCFRVTTMKRTLATEVIKVMPSYHAGANLGPRAPRQDSAKIQGGNWSMQGFRRSGHVHDEDECQMAIAEFMREQERVETVE